MPRHVCVVSHRRSGTHLLIDSLINNFLGFEPAYVNLDHLTERQGRKLSPAELRSQLERPCILKTHSHADLESFFDQECQVLDVIKAALGESSILYIHRDGRDVMVSLFFYMRNFDAAAQEMDFTTFLKGNNTFDTDSCSSEMSRIDYWKYHVEGWMNRPEIHALSYEALLQEYDKTIAALAPIVGRPHRTPIVDIKRSRSKADGDTSLPRKIADKAYRMAARAVYGIHYTSIDFRSGHIGDYRSAFSPADLALFNASAGDLLERLGYETSF